MLSLADYHVSVQFYVFTQQIVEDRKAALEQFREIAVDLGADVPTEKRLIDDNFGIALGLNGTDLTSSPERAAA